MELVASRPGIAEIGGVESRLVRGSSCSVHRHPPRCRDAGYRGASIAVPPSLVNERHEGDVIPMIQKWPAAPLVAVALDLARDESRKREILSGWSSGHGIWLSLVVQDPPRRALMDAHTSQRLCVDPLFGCTIRRCQDHPPAVGRSQTGLPLSAGETQQPRQVQLLTNRT
jgi:hypothetical protein